MATPPITKAQLTPLLQKHIPSTVDILNVRPLTAGASADTWQFDIYDGQQQHALILRRLALEENISTAVSKSTEARVQQAAEANNVIAPKVRFILEPEDQLGEGYVMDRIEGESIPQKILKQDTFAAARQQLPRQCGIQLSRIHTTPLESLPPLPSTSTQQQIDALYALYLSYDHYLPVFDVAFCWLTDHMPAPVPPALVHGDFRNGNLMVDHQGLCGVLDWELTHLGDPMEDIGWLCVNSWRFGRTDKPIGGFGSRDAFYQAYQQEGGTTINEDAVHFWEVFGTLKWGVICLFQCFSHLSGKIRSLERAAIGRRVSETEIDLLQLIAPSHKEAPHAL